MDYPPPLTPPAMVQREYPAPRRMVTYTTPTKVAAKGKHTHKCPFCGEEWGHDDTNVNNVAAHTCPNPDCGRVLPRGWAIYEHGTDILKTETVKSVPVGQVPPVSVAPTVITTPTAQQVKPERRRLFRRN
jgi:hypothetical protein